MLIGALHIERNAFFLINYGFWSEVIMQTELCVMMSQKQLRDQPVNDFRLFFLNSCKFLPVHTVDSMMILLKTLIKFSNKVRRLHQLAQQQL
jgi:hypothetical protein